ncbi:Lipid A core-O-antigen ligase [Cognatishimia activa]|uniref:Lipid A core-O-antigen ligase n=2 Tax=Cognatishimia activa TaxID=1715691 RepID=A0A0P1IVI4_9RHOB|nr:Lipid A core-O-antigen ligase [Cognatishimia activa]CUK27626.1 Lipid A core-O-antigen ligase [Cognatishimia activa]
MTEARYSINVFAVTFGVGFFAAHMVTRFGSMAALLLLLMTFLILWLRGSKLVEDTALNLLLWGYLLLCLLSTLWSPAPSQTLRLAIQLGITFAFAITAASALSATAFYKTVLWVSLVVIVLSILVGRTAANGAWVGVFRSKNDFSQFAACAVMAGFAGVLYGRRRGITLPAFACLGLAAILLVKANSAGALVATAGSCAAMVGLKLLSRFPDMAKVFALTILFLTVTLVALAVTFNFSVFQQILLDATGKDVTLTGRTELWAIAFEEIAQRPLLGIGYKGYWVPGNPTAEMLWEEFGIASKQGFHFHHTLISNAVEVGLIGVTVMGLLFFAAFFRLVRWSIEDPSAETGFLAALMIFTLILMNSEVMFFGQFHKQTVLTVVAMTYAVRLRAFFGQSHTIQHSITLTPDLNERRV